MHLCLLLTSHFTATVREDFTFFVDAKQRKTHPTRISYNIGEAEDNFQFVVSFKTCMAMELEQSDDGNYNDT